MRYVVIGGGMAGILAAIRLKQRACHFVVYEKRGKVGGTWHDNRYPGLTCDVPSHAYTYSFAPNPGWRSNFAAGPEIREYFAGIVDRYGIGADIRFDSEVTECTFSDDDGRWHITLADGATDTADVVIAATGVLHHANKPEMPGLEDFKGTALHSTKWEPDIATAGRRIGVVGTGSTGVQLVGALTPEAERLVHFARSPQWIMPVEQFAYTDEQREAFRSDTDAIDAIRYGEEYQSFYRLFRRALLNPDSPEYRQIAAIVTDNLENSVDDPELRERLRPDYKPMCKRLVMSWNYYDAIQQPNAVLETGEIDRIEISGIRMKDETLHELDLIVFATGFRTDRFIRPTKVTGRGGVELDEVWDVRPVAHNCISVPDFPNLFFLNGPNAPVGNFSLIEIAEAQFGYIEALLEPVESGEYAHISAKQSALEAFEAERLAAAKTTIFASGSTSWYLDSEGIPAGRPFSLGHFHALMKAPRFEDYECRNGNAVAGKPGSGASASR